jgi:hypothetical protein
LLGAVGGLGGISRAATLMRGVAAAFAGLPEAFLEAGALDGARVFLAIGCLGDSGEKCVAARGLEGGRAEGRDGIIPGFSGVRKGA